MEKPDGPQPPLTILHHDEHILFPGYDAMVGNRGSRRHGKDEPNLWTAGNLEARADLSSHGRHDLYGSWYKRHRMQLVVATIIWFADSVLSGFVQRKIPQQSLDTSKFVTSRPQFPLDKTLLTQHGPIKHPSRPCWPSRLHLRTPFARGYSGGVIRRYRNLQ